MCLTEPPNDKFYYSSMVFIFQKSFAQKYDIILENNFSMAVFIFSKRVNIEQLTQYLKKLMTSLITGDNVTKYPGHPALMQTLISINPHLFMHKFISSAIIMGFNSLPK